MITKSVTVLFGAIFSFFAVSVAFNQPPVALVLAELRYDDGMIRQRLDVQGTDVLKAEWAAKIEREGRAICGGGGAWAYTGGEGVLSPSDWTGDDCPELEAGDVGVAVWSWIDSDGTKKSISGEVVIE